MLYTHSHQGPGDAPGDDRDIVLATLNARYIHASFGLRYLRANLGEHRDRSRIFEATLKDNVLDVAEAILAGSPKIVGLGVYIWNAEKSLELAATLRLLAPSLVLVLGGPEVSHETDPRFYEWVDYVVCGDGDLVFSALVGHIEAADEGSLQEALSGLATVEDVGEGKCTRIQARPAKLTEIEAPYDEYTDEDVAHRVMYVEASRGCPFTCAFCLSALDKGVRKGGTEAFLRDMDRLYARGARQFKFVDRTFNLSVPTSTAILDWALSHVEEGLFVHFEVVPDRLPAALRERIAAFPPGVLQLEIGIQTFNTDVAATIARRQNYTKLHENFRFLAETNAHVHADLIAGLPGETLASFGQGFDQLIALAPEEIQVGILKRLRGTPICALTESHGMVYSPTPPYEVLRTGAMSFEELSTMRRFAQLWDRIANSGEFSQSLPLVWGDGSPFWGFLDLLRHAQQTLGRTHSISLQKRVGLLFDFLTEVRGLEPALVKRSLLADYQQGHRGDIPVALRNVADAKDGSVRETPEHATSKRPSSGRATPKRQKRHAPSTQLPTDPS